MKKELLRMENLIVHQNGKPILQGVFFNLLAGEAAMLVGLSDSGIRPLIDVLCGYETVSQGRIWVNEKRVAFQSESDARASGIYRISKEQTLLDELSIAENIFVLRRKSIRNGFINRNELIEQADALLSRVGLCVSAAFAVGGLTTAQKQLVELAKAVGSGAKIIVFDDAFAYYNQSELANLAIVVEQLKSDGLGFLLYCSNVEEGRALVDSISFFRDGEITKKIDAGLFHDSLLEDYVLKNALEKRYEPNHRDDQGIPTIFEARLDSEKLSFSVGQGEAVALLCSDEKRLHELAGVLSGDKKSKSCHIRINGKAIRNPSRAKLKRYRMVFAASLGERDQLFDNLSVEENLLVPSMKKVHGFLGFVSRRFLTLLYKQRSDIADYSQQTSRLERNALIAVALERWLIYRAAVLVLIEPFLQTDAIQAQLIQTYISRFLKSGSAVVILSSRSQHLEDVCDRILETTAVPFSADAASNAPRTRSTSEWLRGNWFGALGKQAARYSLALSILALFLLFGRIPPNWENAMVLLRQCSIFGFSVLGVFLIMLCDGVLLSAGPQAAMASVLIIFLTAGLGLTPFLAVAVSFGVAVLLAWACAKFTAKTGVPVIILSFAMLFVLSGLNAAVENRFLGARVDSFYALAYGNVFHIPVPLVLYGIALVAVGVMLRKTYIGKSILAVGSNPTEARRSGLPIDLVKLIAYLLGFLLIHITGVLFLARTSMCNAQYGNNYLFDVVAALCIGRVSLWGGKGKLIGVVLGTLSVVLIDSLFSLININMANKELVKGIIILIMILFNQDFGRDSVRTMSRGGENEIP